MRAGGVTVSRSRVAPPLPMGKGAGVSARRPDPEDPHVEIVCPGCRSIYELDDAALPRRRLRVRCPGCGRGLHLDGTGRRRLRTPPPPDDTRGWAVRLARALISDILVYHRDRRDAALAEDRLLVEFAVELSAAWTAFKDQLGASAHAYAPAFREAVNEILADGETVLDPDGPSSQ